jgi:hypothetical protein
VPTGIDHVKAILICLWNTASVHNGCTRSYNNAVTAAPLCSAPMILAVLPRRVKSAVRNTASMPE